MFNLNDTGHESGIIISVDNHVGVFNWLSLGSGEVPMISPLGAPIPWPVDAVENAELVHIAHVNDVREHLPGTVWKTEDGLDTDMDVICDENGDLPGLWGFGESASCYEGVAHPYSGDIWELPDDSRVITIDIWI